MNENAGKSDFITALTTEHFAVRSALSATLNETQSRANMYIGALSGGLVAMGFATQSVDIFIPFVATVLPAIFVMGVFTVLRLVDVAHESGMASVCIARIHRAYRSLGPEGEKFFDPKFGQWPESPSNPDLRLGVFVGYWTSAAAMIAAVNALVGSAGVTLLLHLAAGAHLAVALLFGGLFGLGLLVAFHFYQKMRIGELVGIARDEAGMRGADS